MARFVVDLGDVKLTDEQHSALAHAINSAVLHHLSQHPIPIGTRTLVGRVQGGWAGMVAVSELNQIEPLEKKVEAFSRG